MDEQLKENVTSGKTWMRFLYIVLFALFFKLAALILGVLVVVQFVFTLFKGIDNSRVRAFGSSLAQYMFQTISFLTYNSDEKPFPFSDWPEPTSIDALEGEVETVDSDFVVDDDSNAKADDADDVSSETITEPKDRSIDTTEASGKDKTKDDNAS